MDTVSYYSTIGTVFDFLVENYKKNRTELTFPAALETMRRRGLLLANPPAFPPFRPDMNHEERLNFFRQLPVLTEAVLALDRNSFDEWVVDESELFPAGKDIFSIVNMPYISKKLHFHNFFEITYVLQGTCTFLFQGEHANLSEGDICINSPMSGHSLPLEPECIAISIMVRKSTFDSLFSNLLSKQNLISLFFRNSLYGPRKANYILLHTGEDINLFPTLMQLVYESSVTDDYSNSCSVSLLNLFLTRALRASAAISLHHYENYSEKDLDFALILQYIQQNYRDVTLTSLADTFHFSSNYLSTLIRKNMGCNFTDMLRTLKMNHAKDFLINTPMAVNEIAVAVGYDSVDHFSRTFRRVYGVAPQQYRQQNGINSKTKLKS